MRKNVSVLAATAAATLAFSGCAAKPQAVITEREQPNRVASDFSKTKLKDKQQAPRPHGVGLEAASAAFTLALNAVPGAAISAAEFDLETGTWEIDLISGQMQQQLTIDAQGGQVLHQEAPELADGDDLLLLGLARLDALTALTAGVLDTATQVHAAELENVEGQPMWQLTLLRADQNRQVRILVDAITGTVN